MMYETRCHSINLTYFWFSVSVEMCVAWDFIHSFDVIMSAKAPVCLFEHPYETNNRFRRVHKIPIPIGLIFLNEYCEIIQVRWAKCSLVSICLLVSMYVISWVSYTMSLRKTTLTRVFGLHTNNGKSYLSYIL